MNNRAKCRLAGMERWGEFRIWLLVDVHIAQLEDWLISIIYICLGEKCMCMMLYIGADNELPTAVWQEGKVLSVIDLPDDCSGVKKHFQTQHYYLAGAHTGCGCGFQFDETHEAMTPEVNELGKKSIMALFDYIQKYVSADSCELVSFLAGDEEKDLTNKDVIRLNEFRVKDKYRFLECQYIKVFKQRNIH